MHPAILLVLSLSLLAALAAGPALAQGLTGRYAADTPHGPLRLELLADGERLSGTLLGADGAHYAVQGVETDDEDGRGFTGTYAGPGGAGLLALDAPDEDGDRLLRLTPTGPDGQPLHAQTAVVYVRPDANPWPGPAAEPTAPPSTTAQRDPQLVGVWAMQDLVSSGTATLATRLVMQFRADGRFVEGGARSVGGFAGAGLDTGHGGGSEAGFWRTQGGVLYAGLDGATWVPLARYEVSGGRLLLTYVQDGSRQLWYRQ